MYKRNLAASLVTSVVLTTTCGIALSDDVQPLEVKPLPLDVIALQTEQKGSGGLIDRIQNEPVRRAFERSGYGDVIDEELRYSDFTFTFSATVDGQKVHPVLQVAYNGEAQHAEEIRLTYVLCGAEIKEGGNWGTGCFAPPGRVKLEGPFSKGEVRNVKPKKPLEYTYSTPPFVLLPHVTIGELGDKKLDIGTLFGYGIEISPRK